MSIDVIPKFDQMRNAALIQTLEKAWPGCGAHNRAGQVMVKPMMAPAVETQIEAFIKGWNASMDWAREQMVSALPFDEPQCRGSRVSPLPPPRGVHPGSAPRNTGGTSLARRDHRRMAAAKNGIEALFKQEGE